jgi:hypothetical protein
MSIKGRNVKLNDWRVVGYVNIYITDWTKRDGYN